MKKLCLLMMSLFVIGLTACSNDDDNVPSAAQIEGQWRATAFGFNASTSSNGETTTFTGHATNLDEKKVLVTFHEDNTYTSSSEGFTMEVTYKVNGTTTIRTQQNNADLGHGTWSLDGDVISITNAETNDTFKMYIKSESSSTLKLDANQALLNNSSDVQFDEFHMSIQLKRN